MTVISLQGIGRMFDKYLPMASSNELAEAKQQVAEFEAREGGLPGRIIKHNLNLLFILSARRTYEKLRKENSTKLDEIRVFEVVIQDLLTAHMKEYVRQHPDSSLVAINREEAEVKALFLQIFELDATARNRLVVCMSEARSLYL